MTHFFFFFLQVLQEAFDRCMDVLNLSSKEEDTAVQVSLNRKQSNRTTHCKISRSGHENWEKQKF